MQATSHKLFEHTNPWNDADKSLLPLRNALILGEETGHIPRRDDYDVRREEDNLEQALPSLKLIKLLKEMRVAQTELNKVNLEIQCRMQDNETSDLTHLDVIEGKIKKIKTLNGYLESILDSKDRLVHRLQQPFQGDYLKLEAQYHRYASELFPQIAQLLSDLNTNLENIVWAKSFSISDARLDNLISELCVTLNAMQTSFQSYNQIRKSFRHLHQLQTGALHSTVLN